MKKILLLLFALIAGLFFLPVPAEAAQAASITDLRWKTRNDGDPPFVRIVMDLTRSVKAEATISSDGKDFQVILRNTAKGKAQHQYEMDPRAISFATVSEKDGDAYLDVALSKTQKMEDIRVFALRPDASKKLPHRIVVDIPLTGAKSSKRTAEEKAARKEAANEIKAEAAKAPAGKKYNVSSDAKKILKNKVICLDPGHGGSDVGAIGNLGGKDIYEKNITLAIAIPLRDMLTSAGAKVVMTRSTDRDVARRNAEDKEELQARCDVANNAHANAFVSIHIDAIANPSIDGSTAYYYSGSSTGKRLATYMHKAVVNGLAMPDRGIRGNEFYVTVHTTMPSVLMEMGYITNSHRLKMLTSSWGPKTIAKALFNGLVDYFAEVG